MAVQVQPAGQAVEGGGEGEREEITVLKKETNLRRRNQ